MDEKPFLNNISIPCKMRAGVSLEIAIAELIDLADRAGCWIESSFNGFPIFVNGMSSARGIEKAYDQFMQNRGF